VRAPVCPCPLRACDARKARRRADKDWPHPRQDWPHLLRDRPYPRQAWPVLPSLLCRNYRPSQRHRDLAIRRTYGLKERAYVVPQSSAHSHVVRAQAWRCRMRSWRMSSSGGCAPAGAISQSEQTGTDEQANKRNGRMNRVGLIDDRTDRQADTQSK
jgi:hypothetical protein